jgi:hypothetical protein
MGSFQVREKDSFPGLSNRMRLSIEDYFFEIEYTWRRKEQIEIFEAFCE